MKFCEYINVRIQELGIKYIFGVPGSYIMPIWQTFYKQNKLVLSCNEVGAVYMADGLARITKKPSVVLTTLGPGLTNAATGIASVFKDSIPLLLITGQGSTDKIGTGIFQECSQNIPHTFDPVEFLKTITKYSYKIETIDKAIEIFEKSIFDCINGRMGPVHLSIPFDIQNSDIDKYRIKNISFNSTIKRDTSINYKFISNIINNSKRPLILSGWGVYMSNSMKYIESFANRIDALIISTMKGISGIRKSKLYIGHIGNAEDPDMINFLEQKYKPDLLIAFGCSLSSYYMKSLENIISKIKIIRIDIDDFCFLKNKKDLINLNDDIKNFIKNVILNKKLSNNLTYVRKIKNINKYSMYRCIESLNRLLPIDSIVVADAGNHWLDALDTYTPKIFGGFFVNAGLAGMSHAIGVSIGIKLAKKKNKVVCITGDGCILMGGNEITVSNNLNLDIIYIIFNNQSMGRIRIAQKQSFSREYIGTSLPKIDFTKWAESMSINSFKVDNIKKFRESLNKALNYNGTTVIEVIVSKDEIPSCLKEIQ